MRARAPPDHVSTPTFGPYIRTSRTALLRCLGSRRRGSGVAVGACVQMGDSTDGANGPGIVTGKAGNPATRIGGASANRAKPASTARVGAGHAAAEVELQGTRSRRNRPWYAVDVDALTASQLRMTRMAPARRAVQSALQRTSISSGRPSRLRVSWPTSFES